MGGITSAGTISKISLADGSIVKADWAVGLSSPSGIAISGEYLYVANYDSSINTISKISLAHGSIVKADWVKELFAPSDIAIGGQYLYVSNAINDTISKINLTDGSVVKADWAEGFSNPSGIVISGLYLYVSSLINGSSISKIRLADGTFVSEEWATGMSVPSGLVIRGAYLYVSNLGTGTISQINVVPDVVPSMIVFRPFRHRSSSELLSLRKTQIERSLNTVPSIHLQDSSEQTARIRKFASVMPIMPLHGNSATLVKFKASSVVQSMVTGQAYRNAASLYEVPTQHTTLGCSNIIDNFILYGPPTTKITDCSTVISNAAPRVVPFNPVVDLPLRKNDNKVVLQSVVANTAGCGANQ
jgi:DNA-binding beta-propeller fold protein YncE